MLGYIRKISLHPRKGFITPLGGDTGESPEKREDLSASNTFA